MLRLASPKKEFLPSYIEGLEALAQIDTQKAPSIREEVETILSSPDDFLRNFSGNSDEQNLFLIDGHHVVGVFSYRPKLDEILENFGGNVGFGIAPQYRHKGYATKGLALIKDYARKDGLSRLVLTCAPDNDISERVIEKNGGRFAGLVTDKKGRGQNKKFVIGLN